MKNLNKLDLIRIKYFCSSKAVVGSQTGPHQRGQESTKADHVRLIGQVR